MLLKGKRLAILVANGFEQIELTDPKKALENEGARVEIISPEPDEVRGWKHTDWGDFFTVDIPLESADGEDFDGLILPGGVINPDKLRIDTLALQFIQHFFKEGKPVGSICHGPLSLINAGVVKGYTLTSWPSIKIDLINAHAKWIDEKVVVDRNLITSRKPEDLPFFNAKLIRAFAETLVKTT